MGQMARRWPAPPGLMPDYYLRLSVAPVIRSNLYALKGFGEYWKRVSAMLPQHMTRFQIIELKLCLMDAWIQQYGEGVS